MISVIIFWILVSRVWCQEQFSIGILREIEQENIPNDLTIIFKKIEEKSMGKITIIAHTIALNRDEEDDSKMLLCNVLSSGINAIIDLTWSPWPNFVQMITNADILYVHVDTSIKPFMAALTQYLESREAVDAAFIFHNDKDVTQGMHQLLQGSILRVIFYEGMNKANAQRIRTVRPVPSYYGVLATSKNMATIFEELEKNEMLSMEDRWNLVYLDFKTTYFEHHSKYPKISVLTPNSDMCCKFNKNCDCTTTDIDIFENVLEQFFNIFIVALQTNPISSKQINCENVEIVDHPIETELTRNFKIKLNELIEKNKMLNFSIDDMMLTYYMNLTIFKDDSSEDDLVPNIKEIATVNKEHVNQITTKQLNHTKRFFRVGVAEGVPWSYIKRDPKTKETILDEKGNPIWEGYCIDMLDEFSRDLDFGYELVMPKTGTFGKKIGPNKWDGLVGDLMTGEIDIAVAPLIMTAEREEVIDFVAPYFEETGILIVMRQPVRVPSLFKFLTVLRSEVWASVGCALIATSLLIYFLEVYSPYSGRNNSSKYAQGIREFTLKESFWFALTSFTPQGGGEAPKSISSRIVVASYWLFVVLMLATFTANLAAFLTVERMQTPVQSLDQLARQSRINYTVVEGSQTHKFFLNMKRAEDILYRVWKEITLNSTEDQAQYRVWEYPIKEQYGHILLEIENSKTLPDAETGFRLVNKYEDADFAFIHDAAEIKYEISRNCNLTEVGEVFAEQPYSVAIQQGSSLQDEISMSILRLQKGRFFEELEAKYWNSSVRGLCDDVEESEGISLQSLGGVFLATFLGLAVSVVVLIFEVIYYRRLSRRDNVKQIESKNDDEDTSNNTPSNNEEDPPPPFETPSPTSRRMFRSKVNPSDVTIGTEFVPVSEKKPNISYISVFPRKPIQLE